MSRDPQAIGNNGTETVELLGGPRDGETPTISTTINTLTANGGLYRRGMGHRKHRHTVFLWEGKAA
jgi:hypothetical protein